MPDAKDRAGALIRVLGEAAKGRGMGAAGGRPLQV